MRNIRIVPNFGMSLPRAVKAALAASEALQEVVYLEVHGKSIPIDINSEYTTFEDINKYLIRESSTTDFKVESFFVNEELTDGEIDSLSAGNAVVDTNSNTYVVKSVQKDENGDVTLVKLSAYEAPESEGQKGEELTVRLTPKELRKFDLA